MAFSFVEFFSALPGHGDAGQLPQVPGMGVPRGSVIDDPEISDRHRSGLNLGQSSQACLRHASSMLSGFGLAELHTSLLSLANETA